MSVFPYYPGTKAVVYNGESLTMMRQMPDNCIDAVVTDPPYGLSALPPALIVKALTAWLSGDREHVPDGRGFMGNAWDSFVPPPAAFDECMRVLKPGGHLLCFAGSRTVDLMAMSIRLAGFEIRDSIAWLYGSGFPKSLNVSKAIDKAAGAEREVIGQRNKLDSYGEQAGNNVYGGGPNHDGVQLITAPATEAAQQWEGWGTALKPAFEPIVVGRKPFPSTVAANVLEHGTGALNIDGCRVEAKGRPLIESRAEVSVSTFGDGLNGSRHAGTTDTGRWPTNVVLDESQAAELDKQTGVSRSRLGKPRGAAPGDGWGMTATGAEYDDQGGASRFFPTVGYREDETNPDVRYPDTSGTTWTKARREHLIAPAFKYQAKAPTKERPKVDGIAHPTVKPLKLMRWLVRLVTPPDGVVLDFCAGSGTTLEAALLEGFHAVGIEREARYLPLIFERIQRSTPGLDQAV